MEIRSLVSFPDFDKIDIRVGRIVRADPFPEARKPAIKLTIDFGAEIGTRRSSAQLTRHYAPADLPGRLVLAVVNFPPRQIGPFMSEVLTLGVPDDENEVVLVDSRQKCAAGRPAVLIDRRRGRDTLRPSTGGVHGAGAYR